MLLKLGVDISRLSDHCRRALPVVEQVWELLSAGEPVISSTYEGTHSVGSLHYVNRAFDLRRHPDSRLSAELSQKLKERLGKDFDIVLESTHIHVEHDPK